MIGILLAVSTACTSINQAEATKLVLLTPNAIESHVKMGADLAAEFDQTDQGQWVFRVYATNAPPPSSSLIGWYEVDPVTYEVRDWILDSKPIQVTPQLQAFQKRLHEQHCQN